MASSSKTLIAFLWAFLEAGGTTAVALVVQIVLARLLMPETFGVLAILLVLMEIANTIAQSGLGLALIQRSRANSLAYSSAFWVSMALSACLYSAVFLGAPLIAQFYVMPELTLYIRVIAITIFFNAFNSIQRAYLQKRMNFKSLFAVSLIVVVVSGGVGVAAALMGYGVWALILQSVMQSLSSCAILMSVVPWKPKKEFSAPLAKELIGYGGKLCLTGILNVVYTGLSELVIGKACDPLQLGYYSQGKKWPYRALSVVNTALQNVLFPALSRLKNDPEAFRRGLCRALTVGNYILMPVSVLLAVTAEPLVILILSDKWLPSVPVFCCSCLVAATLMLQLTNLRAYMALGHSGLCLKLQIVKVSLGTPILVLTTVLTHDIYIVALALVVFSTFAVLAVDMQPAKRILRFGRLEQLRVIAPHVVMTGIAALLSIPVAFAGLSYLLQLVVQIILFLVAYLGLSYIFKVEALFECASLLKDLLRREGDR